MTNVVAATLLAQLSAAIAPIVAAATSISATPTVANATTTLNGLVVEAMPTLEEDGIAAGANLILAIDNFIKSNLAASVATAVPVADTTGTAS